MILDYPSILLFLAMNNLFIIALFTYQYFYHHKRWYLSVFILGVLFQIIALVLVANRTILPFFYTVQISNLLLISSFALTSFGLMSFDGKIRKNILWLFFVFTILFYCSFLAVAHNNTNRIIIQIIASSFFYGIGAFHLFINKNEYKFPVIISSVLLIYAVFQFFRAFVIYDIGESYDFMKGSTIDNWYLIISMFTKSVTSIGLIMLLKEIDQKTIFLNNTRIQEDKLKLEELNLTKDKLFSIVAHDLRSPFNSILGFSKLLIENLKDFELAESEKYVGFINSSAQNTLVLLENLLSWAKSQTGQITFNPQKIVLSSIISEVIEQSNSAAIAKDISLIHKQADEIEAYADEDILKTVLRNLISNAIKFTKTGGCINMVVITKQKHVEISIADNGIGINEEKLKTLFNIASNTSSPGTANEKGSGLGLVLCKEFVEKLGGSIWVESELGKGSVFKFILPMNKSDE
mgnify:CR=1 FL=1|tara:strand:- start:42801 stop:44192 length:1392 start_codon:yes stop_codon:yes gene_type:complete